MNEPVFITRGRVDALHQRSLEEHGGQDGIRNEHGLESALAQPMHMFAYGQGNLFDLAAAYAYHLAETFDKCDQLLRPSSHLAGADAQSVAAKEAGVGQIFASPADLHRSLRRGQPTVTGMSVIVSLPKMSMTFTAMV